MKVLPVLVLVFVLDPVILVERDEETEKEKESEYGTAKMSVPNEVAERRGEESMVK